MPAPERIAIVGLGLIGGSLALALRRARPDLYLYGIDVDPSAREQAGAESAIDAGSALEDAPLAEFDTVVLCTPAQPLLEMLPGVAARMRPGALLTDVCGAKERICAQAAGQDRVVFIGGHPMAGTEFRGFVAANPTLFLGCTVALCPPVGARDAAARKEAVRHAGELWMLAGAQQILDVQPDAHDRAVTIASHLPYLAAAAVAQTLLEAGAEGALARDLAAGGFRDTTRLAGDGTVGGAAALNRFVPGAARALADRLKGLAQALESSPEEALRQLSETADERRRMRLPLPSSAPAAHERLPR
jgi:prephenate dehydrogenase